MEIINYENNCRFCLKTSKDMFDLFSYVLQPTNVSLVDFIGKISDLKIVKSEYSPNNSCTSCIESVEAAFRFAEMCIVSNEIIKKEEIRRKFPIIAEEALLDENNFENAPHKKEQDLEIGENKLEEWKPIESSPKKIKYTCDICQVKFTNKTEYVTHQKTHDNKHYKCSTCLQTFSKQAYLKIHSRSHEEKKISCKTCKKLFRHEHLLKQHEYKHSGKKPFPCPKCDRGCMTSENLRRHMKTHEENYIKKLYSCTICLKEFPYPSSLSEHMKWHSGEKPHLCAVCGKGFRQSGSLHFHQRIHTGYRPFKCDTCLLSFKSRSLLKVHMRKHTNERPFVCETCGVAFRQSNDLKRHLNTHKGEKPVLCTLCGKRMATTGQLTIHLRTHTGEKPFKCETCEKVFVTKTVLRKHTRIHTGEKPYVCTECNKAFNQSSTLRTHLNIHNRLTGEPSVKTSKKRPTKKSKNISDGERAAVKVDVSTEFTVIIPTATQV